MPAIPGPFLHIPIKEKKSLHLYEMSLLKTKIYKQNIKYLQVTQKGVVVVIFL